MDPNPSTLPNSQKMNRMLYTFVYYIYIYIYREREHDIAHIGMLIYCFLLEYSALTHSRVTVVKSLFSPLLKV